MQAVTATVRPCEPDVATLAVEWRRHVHRVLGSDASPEDIDDALHDALIALCLLTHEGRPRVTPPVGVRSPEAWRLCVLRNYLIDRHRRRHRRAHAERAQALGWSAGVARQAWRSGEALALTLADPTTDEPPVLEWRRMVAALPHLPVRRRVLVHLALGLDALRLAPALAKALGEDDLSVARRLSAAQRGLHGGATGSLSEAAVRAVFPTGSLPQARECARKGLERAIADLQERCAAPSQSPHRFADGEQPRDR